MLSLQHHNTFISCDICRRCPIHSPTDPNSIVSCFWLPDLVEKAKWCDSCSLLLESIGNFIDIRDDYIDNIDLGSNKRIKAITVLVSDITILLHARKGSSSTYVP